MGMAMIISLVGPAPAVAQQALPLEGGQPQSETLQVARMARLLVDYGQKYEDPHAMIAAARMVMRFHMREAGSDRVQVGGGTSAGDNSLGRGIVPVTLNAPAILEEAARYARGNGPLMQLVNRLQQQARSGTRGVARGKGFIKMESTIPASGEREFNWTFEGGEYAEILFVGDSDTNIDVYVYDSKSGELVGSDESYESGAYFSWTPPETKPYTFRVVNRGKYDNTTSIVSN